MMGAPEPAPRVAHGPQIALVLFAAREEEVSSVRGPVTGRLIGGLRATGEQEMSAVAVPGHLPDRLRTVFPLVHGESNVLAIGRPCRRAQVAVDMDQLAN